MKILLVTPLYPPDIADPAPYVKELATRLSKDHTVTILAYNHIPEKIENVAIVSVEKSQVLPIRLCKFFIQVIKHARDAEAIYVQNGPSTELPLVLASFFTRTPFVLRLGDEAALRYARQQLVWGAIQKLAILRADTVVLHNPSLQTELEKIWKRGGITLTDRPLPRPEKIPFKKLDKATFDEYASSWEKHTNVLLQLFEYARG